MQTTTEPPTITPPETLTHRTQRIIAWGIAILISASLLAVWIAFFVYMFWALTQS